MDNFYIEQGPIRPPSEAFSLLLRVTRNCPWNRCEFCHIYKNEKFSLRSVEEVKADIDKVYEIVKEVKALSWKHGFAGEVTPSLINLILNEEDNFPNGLRSVVLWLYGGGKNVFLQDANSLVLKTESLVEILSYLKQKFPTIERITTYARAKTISQKTVEELKDLYKAGLSRIHVGLESGFDPLLQYVNKGVTSQEHIDAGRKVKASGISLSEYVILGLGGRRWWREHAVQTARILNQIDPDFIRVRTLKVLKIMPLYKKIQEGDFELLNEDEVVREERLLIENLEGIESYFTSDHILNLLEEVEGKLPDDKEKMLGVIDRYLSLPVKQRSLFRLGRRMGMLKRLDDLSENSLRYRLEEILDRIEREKKGGLDEVVSELMESFI